MTPLFKSIWRDRQRKESKRKFIDQCGLIQEMDSKRGSILSFDCSEIRGAVCEAAMSELDETWIERVKLPAAGVWLEGVLSAEVALYVTNAIDADHFRIKVVTDRVAMRIKDAESIIGAATVDTLAQLVFSALAIINTPTIINKTLVSTPRKAVASAPSSAWMTKPHTVVRLCVDGKVYDAKAARAATNGRPWHLVRGHFRRYHTKQGTEQRYVDWHFRGDKSLGSVTREYECYTNKSAELEPPEVSI